MTPSFPSLCLLILMSWTRALPRHTTSYSIKAHHIMSHYATLHHITSPHTMPHHSRLLYVTTCETLRKERCSIKNFGHATPGDWWLWGDGVWCDLVWCGDITQSFWCLASYLSLPIPHVGVVDWINLQFILHSFTPSHLQLRYPVTGKVEEKSSWSVYLLEKRKEKKEIVVILVRFFTQL